MGKRSDEIIRRDKNVFLTTTRQSYNMVVDHVEGDYVYDADGKKYVDFTSFISVYNMGLNANKGIREAIKKQTDKLIHPAFTEFYSELPVRFGESLIKMFPKGFGRLFLSNSGTEANEAAIKFARIFTKRQYIIGFYNAFHGRTLGALGITSSRYVQRAHFGPFPGIIHAPYADPYHGPFRHDGERCGYECVDYIRDTILRKEVSPEEVAAIIFEPVQGEGGYIIPPKSFIKGLRELADEHGILLIDDEVQSGYMRTGKFLALDHFGVAADIYAMAKSIGGGIPMGATITRTSLGDLPRGAHSNTFGGNLLAVAAAQESLRYLKANMQAIERDVASKGNYVRKRLAEMKDSYSIIGDVRGLGLMIGVEFVKDRQSKKPAIQERDAILNEAAKRGLLMFSAGESVIRIMPSLTISKNSLEKGLGILEDSMRAVDRA
jgi:4-aminobutyrate aminotransferase